MKLEDCDLSDENVRELSSLEGTCDRGGSLEETGMKFRYGRSRSARWRVKPVYSRGVKRARKISGRMTTDPGEPAKKKSEW